MHAFPHLRLLGAALLAVTLALPFAACESDDNGEPENTERNDNSGSPSDDRNRDRDDDNNGAGGAPANLVGFWEGTDNEGYNFAMNIKVQNGALVSGQWAGTRGTSGVLNGSVSGNRFTYTVVWPTGSVVGGTAGDDKTEGSATVAGTTMQATADPDLHSGTFTRISDPRP